MMIIVEILRDLGFFHLIAIKIAKQAGNYKNFFLFMSLATGLLSPFLHAVTIILIFSSVTVAVCRILKKDPKPLLLSEVFCSNIGGNATLIGEPTNMMVALHTGLTFTDFILVLGPITIICLIICILILSRLYAFSEEEIGGLIEDIDESSFVKDFSLLNRGVAIFLLTIFLFFIHNVLGLSPAAVALLGASLMLIFIRTDITTLLSSLEWGTLLFIGGFFVIVGGLTETGVTGEIAELISSIPFGSYILVVFIGLVSAFGSALIDNVPFVALMIPIIEELSFNFNSAILWWSLLLGANLGGNLTPIASSPNIVAIAISEREGVPISFKEFFKLGLPIGLLTTIISLIVILGMHLIGYV